MNASLKYTLGRIGLFLVVLAALLPVPVSLLLKLMIAVLVSALLAYFLLRGWRDEMAASLAEGAQRRRAEKEGPDRLAIIWVCRRRRPTGSWSATTSTG